MRLNGASKNLLTLAVAVVVCFVIAELIFAFFGVSALQQVPNYRTSSDVWHHGFVPNSSGEFKTSEWDTNYSINSLGFRDREYSIAKPAGVFRILVLGDSYTEGYGVEADQSFPKVLERMLNNNSGGRKYEVINSGIGSYSPILEYLVLKYKGFALQPDFVILNYDWSDPHDDYIYSRTAVWNGADLVAVRSQPEQPKTLSADARGFLSRHSRVYQFFAKKFAAVTSEIVLGDPESDSVIFLRENLTAQDYSGWFNNSVPYLLMIDNDLRQRNVPFVIHTYPYAAQISASAWKSGRAVLGFRDGIVYPLTPFDVVQEFGKENGIPVVSSYAYFKEYPDPSKLFFDYDGHFTTLGHEVAAAALYDFLENSTILPHD